jgi:hypothetical protein
VALGVDPGSVMDQLGHTDPAFTLRIYRHGMRRDQASRTALRELVGLAAGRSMCSKRQQRQFDAFAPMRDGVEATRNPADSRAF